MGGGEIVEFFFGDHFFKIGVTQISCLLLHVTFYLACFVCPDMQVDGKTVCQLFTKSGIRR